MKRCEVGRVYVCMLHGNGSEEVESAAFRDEALKSISMPVTDKCAVQSASWSVFQRRFDGFYNSVSSRHVCARIEREARERKWRKEKEQSRFVQSETKASKFVRVQAQSWEQKNCRNQRNSSRWLMQTM